MKTTDKSLIGKKVVASWKEKEIIATVLGLNNFYPKTAYDIKWIKEDNPTEPIPADCGGFATVMHFSGILRTV